MKRVFIMLLIACSAVTTVSADSAATPQKKAKSVIQSLEGVIAFYAQEGKQTLSVTKNPETGLIESSERIVPFTCEKEQLWTIPVGFEHDEPLSYQYMHLLPGNTELFTLKVVTNKGLKSKDVRVRTNSKQEMWFMCCKNPENPQLRDAYAIVWEDAGSKNVAGTIYMITSLRPDMYERSMDNTSRMIEEADTCVIDTIPVYEEADTCVIDTIPVYNEVVNGALQYNEMDTWRSTLSPQQKAQLEMKTEVIQMNMNMIESTFKNAAEGLKKSAERVGGLMGIDGALVIDNTYEQLYNQNKETDKILQDFIKLVKDYGLPAKEMPQMYKAILQFYTKQNQGLTQLTMARAAQTKKAKKTQKYIQSLTEKYMKEMLKMME